MATTDKLAQIEDPALAELVRRLVEIYHPLRIYLFGSRARGDWGPDSDYDLMLVVPDETPEEPGQQEAAFAAESETRAWSDRIIIADSDFQFRLGARASLPSTVVREGLLLYAA